MKTTILYGAVAAMCMASPALARDWVWQEQTMTFEQGQVQATVAPALRGYTDASTGTLYGQWRFAIAPEGLDVWISEHCARFIAHMGISDLTNVGKCITTHFLINGRDPGIINIDDRWLLADLSQDPTTVQALFEAEARVAAEAERLAQPITLGEAQALIEGVIVNFNLDEAGQAFVVEEVERQLATQAELAITDEVVQDAVLSVLLTQGEELGLSTTIERLFTSVNERMDEFEELLDATAEVAADNAVALADDGWVQSEFSAANARITENADAIVASNDRLGAVQETAAAAAAAAGDNTAALADDGWVRSELAALASTNGQTPLWVMLGSVLGILAFVGTVLLWWKTPGQKKLDAVITTANEAKEKATSAETKAGDATTKVDNLTNRVRDVEELQVLQLTLDAQGRFNCSELTDQRLKELGNNDVITLEVVCLDNRARKIRVTKGEGGDGKPRLHLHGLEKGHDFVDTISLIALYRHVAKARQEDWIIGVTAANKMAA